MIYPRVDPFDPLMVEYLNTQIFSKIKPTAMDSRNRLHL